MTTFRIPTRQDATSYSLQLTLDAATFTLSFDWNAWTEAWFLTIADINGTVLLAGRRIVLGFPLLAGFVEDGFPAGDIVAYDSAGANQEAAIDDLGTRVILLYLDAADLAEAAAAI